MSRTKNSIKNIRFALLGQAVSLIVSFLSRKVFVLILSQEYLGLNGTFSNILTLLSLTELGVGSAITFSLYKPLANNDYPQIKALMALYKKVYTVIGIVVAVLGTALTPFLPYLIKEIPDIPHINAIYLMYVAYSAASYFFTYKRSLIAADQKQYIVTTYHNIANISMHTVQIIVLLITQNYYLFLLALIAFTVIENLALTIKADKLYPYLKEKSTASLDNETLQNIVKNTKAMILHKIGTVVVSGTDNLLLTYFFGVVSVGLYSNYYLIINSLNTVYTLIFSSTVASIGNLGAERGGRNSLESYKRINFFGNWLYGFSSICLFVLLNPFIGEIWLNKDYLFDTFTVFILVANFYVMGMRKATLSFREAFGLYYYDRYKPVFESLINLITSIVLAKSLGVVGVFIGTLISTLTTCFWTEPYILYKHGFKTSSRPFFTGYLINTAITLFGGYLTWLVCSLIPFSGIFAFILKMAVCVILPNLIFLAFYFRTNEFKYYHALLKKVVKHTI